MALKFIVFLFLLFTLSFSGSILVKEGESDIGCLLAFKRDIQNAPQVFDTWVGNFTRCPYSWHGIDCNYGNYSVIGVTLEGLGLVGEVNLSALTGLRMLRSLSIARNQLSGQPFLGVGAFSFWSLESLDLSSNRFSGALPLSFLRVLVELDLSNNQFTGAIPRTFTISFFLRTVNLSQNYLTGELPSLGEFVGPDRSLPLQILDVSCNNITGPLTKSIGYYQSLRTLKLGNNGLSGKLPSELNMLTHLETLDLTKNDFSGTIPHSLKRFRSSFHPGNGMLRFPDSSARDSHGSSSHSISTERNNPPHSHKSSRRVILTVVPVVLGFFIIIGFFSLAYWYLGLKMVRDAIRIRPYPNPF